MKIIKWIPRILTIGIFALGLLSFYRYSISDEVFFLPDPIILVKGLLIYVGLVLGWVYPKIGGWMIIILVTISFINSIINNFGRVSLTEIISFYFVSIPTIIAGILYLIDGYKKSNK